MQFIKKFSFSFTLFLGLLFAGVAVAWSPPTVLPPNGNVLAPLNISSSDQTKVGYIASQDSFIAPNVTASEFCFGEDCRSSWSAVSGGSQWTTSGTDIYYTAGNIGIGVTDPSTALTVDATSISSSNFTTNQLTLRSLKGVITAVAGSSLIGGINFDSNDSQLVNVPKTTASIRALAAGGHTPASLPTDLVFYATPADATTPSEIMRLSKYASTEGLILASGQLLGSVNDSVSKPSYSWKADPNSGMFNIGGDTVGFSTASLERMRISSAGNVGIGMTPAAAYKLDVSGTVRATTFVYPSDERLKNTVETLSDSLSKVLSLRGVSFVWNDGTPKAGQKDIGFIAQEVEKVAPELVVTDESGYKAVDYARAVPLLVNAIHEQQAQINELKARLDALTR